MQFLSPFRFQRNRPSDVLHDKGPDSELGCLWLSHPFGLLSSGIAFQVSFDSRGLLKREGLSLRFRSPDASSLLDSGWVPLAAGISPGDPVLLIAAYWAHTVWISCITDALAFPMTGPRGQHIKCPITRWVMN